MMINPTLMSEIAAHSAATLRQSAEPRPQPRVGRPAAARPRGSRWALIRRQVLALGLPENDLL